MRIAINAGFYKSSLSGNTANSFFNFFLSLAGFHPEHTFIFIFDKPYQPSLIFPENVIPVVTGPEAKSPLTWRLWYNVKIPFALKRHNADIFITEKFCSLRTHIPQMLFYPDLDFIYQPSFINKRHLHFYKKYTPRFLHKCEAIIVSSAFSKNNLISRYPADAGKVSIFFPDGYEDFKPLSYEEKEKIKEEYADGNEYFIYHGIISPQQNLKNLLKAFSAFKKRQKSSMQLLVTGDPGIQYEEWLADLELYRFHSEVKALPDLPENAIKRIIAASYAMVYTPLYETFYTAPLQAMACGTPLIVSDTGSLPEACADAVLYADPNDFRSIAEKMMLMFKDEQLRKELIQKGVAQLKNIEATRLPVNSFHGFSFFK